jgi:hypothetical protein
MLHLMIDAGARLSGGRAGSRTRRELILDEIKKQQAGRYRTRAEQIRTTAEVMTHDESRISLLRLADSYDRLALRIEYERHLID